MNGNYQRAALGPESSYSEWMYPIKMIGSGSIPNPNKKEYPAAFPAFKLQVFDEEANKKWTLRRDSRAGRAYTYWMPEGSKEYQDFPELKVAFNNWLKNGTPVFEEPETNENMGLYPELDGSGDTFLIADHTKGHEDRAPHFEYYRTVRASHMKARINKEWGTTVRTQLYEDTDFIALTDDEAKRIWSAADLNQSYFSEHVFDCDDFSYVMKGAASTAARLSGASFAYGLGVIFGESRSKKAHASNVFVSPDGGISVLEPQTGKIVRGREWSSNDGEKLTPYFILM